MTSKSRRGQGKHSARGKRGKVRQDFSAASAQTQATGQSYRPVPHALTPSAKVPALRSVLTAVRYPYIVSELRRIAIIAGIMLAVLVVLYLVIH